MTVPFTQFLRPDGRKQSVTIERPPEIAEAAQALIARGCRFEIEVLRTGEVSMECCREVDGEARALAQEIVENGPPVLDAVDRLVREAAAAIGPASMTARNNFESAARSLKVSRLVAAVARQAKIDATTAPLIVATLEALDAAGWERLRIEAGCKRPPSATTIAEVIAEVRRLAGAGPATPGEDWTADVEGLDDEPEPDWDELAQEAYDHDARLDDEIDRQNSGGW